MIKEKTKNSSWYKQYQSLLKLSDKQRRVVFAQMYKEKSKKQTKISA